MESALEHSPGRILLEVLVGGFGGALVARVLPEVGVGMRFFVLLGAFAAPVALLLTPTQRSLAYRAVRYGVVLAVVVSLIVSFAFGADGISGAGLFSVAVLVFAIGVVGHALMLAATPRGGPG